MKKTIATLPKKMINKMGTKDNPTYYVVVPKPLIDGQVLYLDRYYNFGITEAIVIKEGVGETKRRIKRNKKGMI